MNLYELVGRFLLLTISILILYFFSNRKDNKTINPLIVIVGLCTFSLCYLFTKIEIGVGIGFGLFAIFSILRFRAQTFTINAIIFLFATITLSILDIMHPLEKYEILLFLQVTIIGSYIVATHLVINKESKYLKSIEIKLKYDSLFNLEDETVRKVIAEKINSENFEFKIASINTISNEVDVKIYY
ncbi:DUF4956 domain-containing protein [Flavobacterium sp.]|uniref:DUF4956 domain-containing protein n=1 Tax=Flavobacterium sp. TaxID=239 RepID=UPI00374DCF0C